MKHAYDPAQVSEFQRRHERVVQALSEAGAAHYVLTTTENIFYMTGATFEPLERPFFLVIGADGTRRMLVPMLEIDHMEKAWGFDAGAISFYREFPAPPGEGWRERLLDGKYLSSPFAFECATPWDVASEMVRAGGRSDDLISAIRLVKSPWEIAQIERAARYADWGVAQILRKAWNGASAAETYMPTQALQRKIIREVPQWDALASKVIAAAWPAPLSAEPHSVPRMNARLEGGPHVAMVLTRVNGYAAESERTFFTRTPDAHERQLFDTMTRAREIAFAMVRPGVACAEIDLEVNRFLAAEGFGDFRSRLHRCGHGFGLGNHEPPWVAAGSEHVLEENMLISIEPGIYVRGEGGYRHSDTVLVTANGYRCLTNAPRDLASLTLSRTTLRHRVNSWLVSKALGLEK